LRSRAASLWRWLIVIGFLTAIARPDSSAAACVEYELVSLTGRLVRQTYPGPPDYESVTKGDKPVVIWVLVLERRIDVVSSNPSYPRQYNEREVQLVLEASQYRQYANLLGERIIATGKLFHGGARYEKRLVLTASEIKKARVGPASSSRTPCSRP
jgi:hypothetical protein